MILLTASQKVGLLGAINSYMLSTIDEITVVSSGMVLSIGCPLECNDLYDFDKWSKHTISEAAKYVSAKLAEFKNNIVHDAYLSQNTKMREDGLVYVIKINLCDKDKVITRLKYCMTSVPL